MPKTLGSLKFRRKQFFRHPAWETLLEPITLLGAKEMRVIGTSPDRQIVVKGIRMPDKILTAAEVKANRAMLTYVKDWIRFRGTSQRRLAEALEVSEPTVSKWLAGSQSVTVAQFAAIAKFLDAEPSELMGTPPTREMAIRYRRIAEVAKKLPEDALDEWLAIGSRLTSSDRAK